MIRINIHNDGSGDSLVGNYDVEVYLTGEGVVPARVEGFDRRLGWAALAELAVEELKRRTAHWSGSPPSPATPSRSACIVARVHGTGAPKVDPDDGLTNDEGAVMDSLVEAYEAYTSLPVQHSSEPREFEYHIHMLQGLLACRIARRAYPKGWPDGV